MKKLVSLVGFLLAASLLQGAVIVGDYSLTHDLSNNLGSGFAATFVGGTPSSPYGFVQHNDVFGESRNVLRVTGPIGVNIDTSQLTNQGAYTVLMEVNTGNVTNYNALMHVDSVDDIGLYFNSGRLYYYSWYETLRSNEMISANAWHRLAVTRAADGTVTLYASAAASRELSQVAQASGPPAIVNNNIWLFKDNGGENYDMYASRIVLADGVLSLSELNDLPTVVPELSSLGLCAILLLLCGSLLRRRR